LIIIYINVLTVV